MPTLNSLARSLSALSVLARAAATGPGREMLREMRRMQAAMPARYAALPLPDFLTELTPERADWAGREEQTVRALVDALAFWDRSSPFGICLRRSLLRYHFLRRTGLPLGVTLAMRKRREDEPPGLAGHAWTTLNGQPWHERAEDMAGFTVVYHWPPAEAQDG